MTDRHAASHHPTDEPARGSLRLLADPVFGPFFVAKLLSAAGVWIHNIVAAILAYELTGSALAVGMVTIAQFGPQLVFAPLSGAIADRTDRRRQLMLGRALGTAGSASLAVWVGLAGVEGLPGAWPVVAAALLVGLGFVVSGPAQDALLPALVRPSELAPAVALNTLPPTIARAGGPAIGAVVAVTFGPAAAFAIAAAANVVFMLVLACLNIQARAENVDGADGRVRAGLRYVRSDRTILFLLVGVGAVGIGADPVITLTPPLSARFGAGSALVGTFASSFGIGAGATFLFLRVLRDRLGLRMLGTLGLALLSAGTAAAGLSPTPQLALVSFAAAGVGMTLALTSLTTQLQQRLPDEMRGRVMALWAVAFLGSRPLAAALNGWVSDATAPSYAFMIMAIGVAAAAWICRPSSLAPSHTSTRGR